MGFWDFICCTDERPGKGDKQQFVTRQQVNLDFRIIFEKF